MRTESRRHGNASKPRKAKPAYVCFHCGSDGKPVVHCQNDLCVACQERLAKTSAILDSDFDRAHSGGKWRAIGINSGCYVTAVKTGNWGG